MGLLVHETQRNHLPCSQIPISPTTGGSESGHAHESATHLVGSQLHRGHTIAGVWAYKLERERASMSERVKRSERRVGYRQSSSAFNTITTKSTRLRVAIGRILPLCASDINALLDGFPQETALSYYLPRDVWDVKWQCLWKVESGRP